MWGLMLRIQGAQVDASVPGWLLNATATTATINLAKRAAIELSTRPDVYGFDPDAVHSVLVQTWDRATTDVLSVAYGRNVVGHSRVGMLLDFYYMAAHGFRDLRRAAIGSPRWAERSDCLVWRGSVTGDNTIVEPGDLPRIRLAIAGRDWPDADIGLVGVHSTMNNGRPPGVLSAFVAAHNLRRERWNMADFGRYKYVIDIDGHANAWGFLEKLILGCCVLKVDSPYEQWFYDRIKPWQHYVPVRGDLSNLRDMIAWCRDNDAHCRWIGANGARLAASLTLDNELPNTCRALMAAAHKRRVPATDRPPVVRPAPLFRLEDAAMRAEDGGDLDAAVDAYGRLVDAGLGTAGMLMRRHDLLRQRGDFLASQVDMERAVAAEPGNDEPALRYGQFLALIGRDAAAVRLLEPTVALAPERDEIRVSLANSCLKLGWLDKAFRAVRDLPDDLPHWWADLRREVLDVHKRRHGRAAVLLKERRVTGMLSAERWWELALALFEIGRLEPAARLCRQVGERYPTAAGPVELTVRLALRRQGPEQALRQLASPGGGDGQGAALRAALGADLLYDLGRYEQALEAAGDLPDDGDAGVRLKIAVALVMLGRRNELVAHCRRWMEWSPHDMRPAELVCAAEPAPPVRSAAPASPLLLGQYWEAGPIPDAAGEVMASWSDANNGLKREIHDREGARAFLQQGFDQDVVRAFDLCPDPATRAGYFRLAWLLRNGGLWIAPDQRCIASATPTLTAAAASELAAVRSGYITGFLQDAFLAGRAGSPTLALGLRAATALIHEAASCGQPLWSWRAVGPGLLTDLAARSICDDGRASSPLLLTPMLYGSFASAVRSIAIDATAGGG
jgi:tetratricopeptide (TPR) repeat protein